MNGKFCLKTTTRVCMKYSQESRRQTHCITCENSSVNIAHNANIKKRPFMLYICMNQYAENDLIKNKSKNKKTKQKQQKSK
jgi:hypothetical protein